MLVSVGATETEQTVKTKEHGTGWDTAYGGGYASVAVRILLRDIPQVSGIIALSVPQNAAAYAVFIFSL